MIIEWSEIVEFQYNNHQIYAWGDVLITRGSYFLRIETYPSEKNSCMQLLSPTEVLASESHRDFEEASDAIHQGFNQFKQFIRETWPRYAIHQQPNRGWCVRPVSEICNALAQTKYHQRNTSPFYNRIETMKNHFSSLTKGDVFGNLFSTIF